MNEDVEACYYLARKCEGAVYTSKPVYFYFKNVEGVTNSGFSKKKLDLLDVWDIVQKQVEQFTPEYSYACEMNCKRARFTLLTQMNLNGYDHNDSFMIEINPSNKTINIYCLNKKYYLKGESIACYECAKAYEYCYNENNRVEVSSPTTICDCFFNEDGLMSKKEITITYDDALFMEITRKQVFVKYFLEQGNYKEAENILLSYKEKLKALPILHDDKFKVIFERNNECFTIVNKSLQCLISDNIVYEDKKEIYLNPENRLYDLNCFDDICSKDENYLNGIEKEENKKLKETYLRRLRSLD